MDIKTFEKKYTDNPSLANVKDLEERLSVAHSTGEDMSFLSSELAFYSNLSTRISEIQKLISQYQDTLELVNTEDFELKQMGELELKELEEKILVLDKDILSLQVERKFHDLDDNKPSIIEIRAGAGGDEAALFAADIFRMYKLFAESQGWIVDIVDGNITEGGGYKEIVAHIDGKNVYKLLKYESGVHRVQRIPVTESSGRIHTSTASVAVLPEAKDIDVNINPEDLKIDVMRASGAGGQCVNKTDSAVRITHLPSGIVVSCQETKHQAQNKEKAMALLRSKLYELKKQEEHSKRADLRSSQIGTGDRSEKIRTYNFPQNRITDHRIKKSWFNLEEILNGNIKDMLDDVRKEIQIAAIKDEQS